MAANFRKSLRLLVGTLRRLFLLAVTVFTRPFVLRRVYVRPSPLLGDTFFSVGRATIGICFYHVVWAFIHYQVGTKCQCKGHIIDMSVLH